MMLEKAIAKTMVKLTADTQAFLTFPNDALVACEIAEYDDHFVYRFDAEMLKDASLMAAASKEDKFRFLYNCGRLEALCAEYDFSIAPENLRFTINLMPKILVRSLKADTAHFLQDYKALIAWCLTPRYSFEDYCNGGADLARKSKIAKAIFTMQSVAEIRSELFALYEAEVKKTQKSKKLVHKSAALAAMISLPLLSVLLVCSMLLFARTFFVTLPLSSSITAGYGAFLHEDYLGVQKSLASVAINDLPQESKYALATSYIIAESLTSEQKNNILKNITPKTDAMLLDYWIETGRLNMTNAIDLAKRMGDDELLLFAYIKEKAHVAGNSALSGVEKETQLADLNGKIKTLSDTMAKERDDATAESEAPIETDTPAQTEAQQDSADNDIPASQSQG